MSKPNFTYVTFIATTAEQLWDALTVPEITRRYWGHENVSDWLAGSKWEHRRLDDERTLDIVGLVLETAWPKRLVLSWMAPADAADPAKQSRVTFQIRQYDGYVRLTLRHEDLEAYSAMLWGIQEGWPIVLSNLKTLLETGAPLPDSVLSQGDTRARASGRTAVVLQE